MGNKDSIGLPQAAVRIEGVSHAFNGRVVLAETTLHIRKNELIALIGPSGCGKSTLLNAIGGLLTPDVGAIFVDDTPVSAPLPGTVSFIFQERSLFPWNTVLENIELGMRFRGISRNERRARAEAALNSVGLQDFAHYYPGQLSGGMSQRAALARALSLDTDVILMDEPFAALDEQTRMVLGEDLSALLAKTGKTIIFVTHSLGEAVFLADRVAIFSARPGRIKKIIEIQEDHPRNSSFATCGKFSDLRNELYSLLHSEIRTTLAETQGLRHIAAGQ
jgi:NitT/TauT family transport system ATP-binding protein